jgi:hypothetical protein
LPALALASSQAAFAQAIGADQEVPVAQGGFSILLLALIVAIVAGNRLDIEASELPAEKLAHPLGNVMSGRNETEKDDRPIAVAQQIPKDRTSWASAQTQSEDSPGRQQFRRLQPSRSRRCVPFD